MTKIQSSDFKWKGSYALNARKAYSQKISLLRSVLREHCEKIHLSTDTQNEPEQLLSQRPQKSYVLAAVVSNYLEENLTSVVSFDDVIKHIKCSDNILSKLLRKEDGNVDRDVLIDLWQTLKQFSQFSINEYFIVLNLHQLLSNIN